MKDLHINPAIFDSESGEYERALAFVLANGIESEDRTNIGTISQFGLRMSFDLAKAFPLVTTKKLHLKSIIHELIWMLNGYTNVGYLQANDVTIWDEWASESGELGPVYGKQWRRWAGKPEIHAHEDEARENSKLFTVEASPIDQIANVIKEIREFPNSRRLVVSAWNPADIPAMALAPCHVMFQFYVRNGELSCQLYQRSGDMFLGIPFNIASYALLTHIIAFITGLKVGKFIHIIGDAHIYSNHIEQVKEQLTRAPKAYPQLSINRITRDVVTDPAQMRFEDFKFEGYDPHPAIKGEVAV
ncbi:thymidylate synthase [Dyella telluris]|uniref:Thymidylate synthase n=1 Tax=Dyella telluris TaxID=2763498 RepID=A0A7G8Q4M7_9GAMM|nr:thymidylate synthase [Dyella telluris]QNK01735.1 thymidylate synthase [Dyella telluris]